MPECEHLARTSSYFDGALAPADEAAATSHLAGCAECQALLGDAIGISAALSGARTKALPRGRLIAVAGIGLAAAAAVALWLGTRRSAEPTPEVVAIVLPQERALEVRFTGARFAPHRTLGVMRGDRAREPISLAALVELEHRGELHDLVAALAASGDPVRAAELASQLPADGAGESDRAAIALATGDVDAAVRHAARALELAPALAAARWNLALAARTLGLPHVARAELAQVAAVGEPGWADEARRGVEALAAEAGAEPRVASLMLGGPVLIALLPSCDAARCGILGLMLEELRLAGD